MISSNGRRTVAKPPAAGPGVRMAGKSVAPMLTQGYPMGPPGPMMSGPRGPMMAGPRAPMMVTPRGPMPVNYRQPMPYPPTGYPQAPPTANGYPQYPHPPATRGSQRWDRAHSAESIWAFSFCAFFSEIFANMCTHSRSSHSKIRTELKCICSVFPQCLAESHLNGSVLQLKTALQSRWYFRLRSVYCCGTTSLLMCCISSDKSLYWYDEGWKWKRKRILSLIDSVRDPRFSVDVDLSARYTSFADG